MQTLATPEFIVAAGSLIGVILSWVAARGSQRIEKSKASMERYEGMVDALNSSYKTLAEDLQRNRELVDQQRQDAEKTRAELAAQAREINKLGTEVKRHARALESLRGRYEQALDYLDHVISRTWEDHGVRLPDPPEVVRTDLNERRATGP